MVPILRIITFLKDHGGKEDYIRQPSDANPEGSPVSEPRKFFKLNGNWSRLNALNGNCSRICSCRSLASQQVSTAKNFVMLSSKEFREERRVEHLVPNQIPGSIGIYRILWPVSGCIEPVAARSWKAVELFGSLRFCVSHFYLRFSC
jgi:hypothetical protein